MAAIKQLDINLQELIHAEEKVDEYATIIGIRRFFRSLGVQTPRYRMRTEDAACNCSDVPLQADRPFSII